MKSEKISLEDFLRAIAEGDPVTVLDSQIVYSGTMIQKSSNPEEIKFLCCVPDATNFELTIKKSNGLYRLVDGRNISLVSHEKGGFTIIVIPQK
ncbi:MAG TPA: hypothetical protein VMC41_01710 [Candidatus Nanoarchaeia archaeon]|nr:hypothetical protein [Candidatus Nanoarchaeia archaeon]